MTDTRSEGAPMHMPSKWKYRKPKTVIKNGQYRARTGPACCSQNCAKHGPVGVPRVGKRARRA